MRPVIFDIDGVLADFVYGFLCVVNSVPGGEHVTPYTTHNQKVWDFALPAELIREAWSRVKLMRNFWNSLPPLVADDVFKEIESLRQQREVYFATSRIGHKAHEQTREWLVEHGVNHPSVVVTPYKGQFARAVNAATHIDDKAGNAVYVAYESPHTKSFILNRLYNQFDHTTLGSKVTRVLSVSDYLKAIESE